MIRLMGGRHLALRDVPTGLHKPWFPSLLYEISDNSLGMSDLMPVILI